LFEPFFTTKDPGQGTGLGLPVVQGVVAQNGGAIRVRSEVGQGACFSLWLPAVEPEVASRDVPSPTLAVAKPATTPASSSVVSILLVEDERLIRELIAEYLTACGYKVIAVEHPLAAIELLTSGALAPVRLLISDVLMPGMTGLELADEMRRRLPDVRLLLMSGFPGHAAFDDLKVDPSVPFLEKPFSMDALVTTVRQCLWAGPQG
jgi:two-component system cell cycle sensor histidine kinase/response regulator CckA